MLKLSTLFSATPSPKDLLSEILNDTAQREVFLGMKVTPPPARDQVAQDANRMLRYSQTKDYAVFAQEAWAEILKHLDKLMDASLSDRQVDFHRAGLSATVNLLRVSYLARNAKEANEANLKQA